MAYVGILASDYMQFVNSMTMLDCPCWQEKIHFGALFHFLQGVPRWFCCISDHVSPSLEEDKISSLKGKL